MLQPARTKFRKQMKGRMKGLAYRGSDLSFGEYGLKAIDEGRVNARQIEAARIAITRCIKRGGKVWIRVFPDKPITKKPLETRMGHGKGNVEEWVAVVKPGQGFLSTAVRGILIVRDCRPRKRNGAPAKRKRHQSSLVLFSIVCRIVPVTLQPPGNPTKLPRNSQNASKTTFRILCKRCSTVISRHVAVGPAHHSLVWNLFGCRMRLFSSAGLWPRRRP